MGAAYSLVIEGAITPGGRAGASGLRVASARSEESELTMSPTVGEGIGADPLDELLPDLV
jgi:hypothetical protein